MNEPPSRRALATLALLAGCSRGSAPAPQASAEPPSLASAPRLVTPASTPPPSAIPASASASAAAPFNPATATAALVWQAKGKAAFKTVWVEEAPAGPTVRRERGEPVIASQRGFFALRNKTGKDASVDAVPLASGQTVEVAAASAENCPAPSDQEAQAWVVGAVGSVVFAASHGFAFACGAPHPQWSDQSVALDLDTGKPVAFSPFPGLSRLEVFANKKFADEFGDDGGGCLLDPKEAPTFYSADFAYASNGRLRGHYVFTKSSNYMCGTGPGHYSRTEELHDSSLPPAMERWKNAPRWLLPYLVKHPSVGVSALPPELTTPAAIALFEAPLPKAATP